MKLQRTYKMTVQGANDPKTKLVQYFSIEYPLSLMVDISRNTFSSCQTGRFRIFNLPKNVRDSIYKDKTHPEIYRKLTLNAGYQSEKTLPEIFKGNVINCFSYRQKTDWITEIECFSGIYAMAYSDISFEHKKAFNIKRTIESMVAKMQNVYLGKIGDISYQVGERSVLFDGKTWEQIKKIVGENADVFIDNEVMYILKENEYINSPSGILVVSSETGLLGTPRRHDVRLDVEMIFEPRVVVGQLVEVRSLEKQWNGLFKVIGLNHRGLISGAKDGGFKTGISLWSGLAPLTIVN